MLPRIVKQFGHFIVCRFPNGGTISGHGYIRPLRILALTRYLPTRRR
jgi:hypothetical protein